MHKKKKASGQWNLNFGKYYIIILSYFFYPKSGSGGRYVFNYNTHQQSTQPTPESLFGLKKIDRKNGKGSVVEEGQINILMFETNK